MEEEKAIRIKDVWALGLEERWQLCRYWYNKWYINKSSELNKMLYKFEELALRRREFRTEEDLRILDAAQIIGMTTTGAAKYRSILQHIRPKIVIVEEAAEVLESHIVTTLSSGFQHLILIGDHQQLRPNPIVYKLAKIYNLEISLFERLVRNNLHHEQLSLQHRMRPEIAELMKHFYTNLANHDSVKDYENIRGVNQNIFFIKHDKEEEFMEETKSRSNSHEAEFLIALCHYFLQQGYNPSQITILTMYTAQLLEFRKLMKQHDYHNVRVCPVDNFQGEENCIVLLSL
ncbi:NFX1-type zinc finger-containing protein 1-like, partial [Saccoglossus kowalevskii]